MIDRVKRPTLYVPYTVQTSNSCQHQPIITDKLEVNCTVGCGLSPGLPTVQTVTDRHMTLCPCLRIHPIGIAMPVVCPYGEVRVALPMSLGHA